jgi:hypothetical protein
MGLAAPLTAAALPLPICTEILTVARPAALDTHPRQPVTTIESLYADAVQAQPALIDLAERVAASTGAQPVVMGLKQRERVSSKVQGREGGDASRVLDVARAALVYDDLGSLYDGMKAAFKFAQDAGITVLRVKDRFLSPKDTGYRDLQMNLRVPLARPDGSTSWHVVELQFHLKDLYELKKGEGDALYREIRTLEERRPLDTAASARLEELKRRHRELFEAAFQRYSLPNAAPTVHADAQPRP